MNVSGKRKAAKDTKTMAHHIVDGMISYNAETPWHGLGSRVNADATPEEMLAAAKLDWTVEMRSLAVSCTVNGANAWCSKPMADFKAVVRSDNHQVFAVPTKKYKPVQNLEVATFFRDFADAASCELQVVGALDGGRKVWALAKVADSYVISRKGAKSTDANGAKDEQLGYVMLATSHDGSLRTIAMGTCVYVVCWNTMSAALASVGASMSNGRVRVGKTNRDKAMYTLKHTSHFDAAQKREAASVVNLVKMQQDATSLMGNAFADVSLDDRGRIEFIRRLIGGESVLEQIVNDAAAPSFLDLAIAETEAQQEAKASKLPEETRLGKALIDSIIYGPGQHMASRKDTLWGAVNGVTYYVDHKRGRSQDSTLDQAWFGQGAKLKEQAIEIAYDMSGLSRLKAD